MINGLIAAKYIYMYVYAWKTYGRIKVLIVISSWKTDKNKCFIFFFLLICYFNPVQYGYTTFVKSQIIINKIIN